MALSIMLEEETLTLEQRKEYEEYLQDVVVDGTLRRFESLGAFKAWVDSDYQSYPFSGGRLEQPKWVLDDFDLLGAWLELEYLNLQRPTVNKNRAMK